MGVKDLILIRLTFSCFRNQLALNFESAKIVKTKFTKRKYAYFEQLSYLCQSFYFKKYLFVLRSGKEEFCIGKKYIAACFRPGWQDTLSTIWDFTHCHTESMPDSIITARHMIAKQSIQWYDCSFHNTYITNTSSKHLSVL